MALVVNDLAVPQTAPGKGESATTTTTVGTSSSSSLSAVLQRMVNPGTHMADVASENAVVTLPAERPEALVAGEEPELTKEERLAMANAMRDNCQSLSNLLQHMVSEEQRLKELCAEFIIRDVEEENARIALTNRCLQEQQATMQSAAYVRWAQEKRKGTLAHGAVPGEQPRDVEDEDEDDDDDESAGVFRPPPAAYAFHEEGLDAWYMSLDRMDSEEHFVTIPGRAFVVCSALVQYLRGWRQTNANIASELEDLEQARAELQVSHGEPMVCIINGELAWAPPSDVPTLEQTQAFQGFVDTKGFKTTTIEERYAAWSAWRLQCAAVTRLAVVLPACTRAVNALRDDGSDVIAFAPMSWFINAVQLRVVVQRGRVICAETPMPDASVHVVADVKPSEAVERVQAALQLAGTLIHSDDLRVLCCSIKRPVPGGSLQIAVQGGGKATPDIPMDRFAWSDVCGIAQRHKNATLTQGEFRPVLRAPTARVAEITVEDSCNAGEASRDAAVMSAWFAWLCDDRTSEPKEALVDEVTEPSGRPVVGTASVSPLDAHGRRASRPLLFMSVAACAAAATALLWRTAFGLRRK